MASIDRLIISSPYVEPATHWEYDEAKADFVEAAGRRPAGYFVMGQESNRYNDLGRFVPIPLVNNIRPRVKAWHEAGYPGVTGVTRDLLTWWNDPDVRALRYFWCQLDAIETLIWLLEGPAADKVGINIPSDGGSFQRLCTKLCTGGGKTIVMAMLIAWQVCNKVTYPQDARFSKGVLIMAPGLTVRDRLQVLVPGSEGNYYERFDVVPQSLRQKLNQATVVIRNWQALSWETEEQIAKKKSVDKRGALSDAAYVRKAMPELARMRNLLVINDEAHHAWRTNPEGTKGYARKRDALTGQEKKDYQASEAEATVWVGALDRINNICSIRGCYDFSATPFSPSGKRSGEDAFFGWTVSDFGLNDGIESGLVKTPRMVFRDDGLPDPETMKSKLYHIYADDSVKSDINRPAEAQEPLPDLLHNAYRLLGKDWERTAEAWGNAGLDMPPVMLTVANRTETAARIEYEFLHRYRADLPHLSGEQTVLRIDSKVLAGLEDKQATGKRISEQEQELRAKADTVGQPGKPGQDVRNVISVGMLSEGWDARTVTHIMGLRAFSSQLLCEQVIGRGLRRTSYDIGDDGMLAAEYVNIFGIPFTFLPHEGDESEPRESKPKTQIESLPERSEYEISWPNVVRIDTVYRQQLALEYEAMDPLVLDASDAIIRADLAPHLNGHAKLTELNEIDLRELDQDLRLHREVFVAASQVWENVEKAWQNKTTKYAVLGQIVRLTEDFVSSDRLVIKPKEFAQDDLRRRILIALGMTRIVRHIWDYIRYSQSDGMVPVFGSGRRIVSTSDMPTWFTTKPTTLTQHSQINRAVADSSYEAAEADVLDMSPHVKAWAKNDHLGFRVQYVYDGVVRQYYPDYLVILEDDTRLVIETKGQMTQRDASKRKALEEWVLAVNQTGEFGRWTNTMSFGPMDLEGKIEEVLGIKH